MSNSFPRTRGLRWQFSLRMILLLTAIVGLALMIFRWPWVEEESLGMTLGPATGSAILKDYRIVRRTTYHRDWRGKPVKHGLEQSFRNRELWHELNYYDGVWHGRRRIWNWDGKLAIEATYRGGILYGTYRSIGPWEFEGQYNAGNWDGEWRGIVSQGLPPQAPYTEVFVTEQGLPDRGSMVFLTPLPRPLKIATNYRMGKRHGTTIWRTMEGEMLNTAEFADDELVSWNGQPVVAQFRAWLRMLDDPQLVAQLETTSLRWHAYDRSSPGTIAVDIENATPPMLLIHTDGPSQLEILRSNASSLIATFCENAANQGYGFDYRYGALWLVPREVDPAPPFVDPTGVAQITFEPESNEAREWAEIVDVQRNSETVSSCVAQLLEKTSIQYELQTDDPSTVTLPNPAARVVFRRSRRDALGYVLYRAGCRCDFENGKLIFRVRNGYEEDLRRARPLSL